MVSIDKNQMAKKMRKSVEGQASDLKGKLQQVPSQKVQELRDKVDSLTTEDFDSVDNAIDCIKNTKDSIIEDIKEKGGVIVDDSAVEVSGCVSADRQGINISPDGTIKTADCKFGDMANDLQDSALSQVSECMNSALSDILNIMSKLEQLVSTDLIDNILEAESCISAKTDPSGIDTDLENKLSRAGLTLDGEIDYSTTSLSGNQIDKLRELSRANSDMQNEIRKQVDIKTLPKPEF